MNRRFVNFLDHVFFNLSGERLRVSSITKPVPQIRYRATLGCPRALHPPDEAYWL